MGLGGCSASLKRVLFVCVGNMCRSPMAEGFARHLAPSMDHGRPWLEVRSAGTHHAGRVHELSIQAMAEVGIDISDLGSKPVDWEFAAKADRVVLCGAGVHLEVPKALAPKTEPWSIPDPYGHDIRVYRVVRDKIQERVERLLRQLAAERARPETKQQQLLE